MVPKCGSGPLLVTNSPTSLLPGQTSSETQYFRYFYEGSMTSISSIFGPSLCNQVLLQKYRSHEFVRRGVIALAALQKSYEMASNISTPDQSTPSTQSNSNYHRRFALHDYSKSIQAGKIMLLSSHSSSS